MSWRELPPLKTDLATQLPELPEICFVAGPIADHRSCLLEAELPAIARAQERRAWEFATGRHLARCAMADLGAAAGEIPRARDRSPAWPEGLIGSITHAGEVAVAAVAREDSLLGLGIDLERAERVEAKLFRKLFTDAERRLLERCDARLPGLLFSAKEAAYKAVYPRVGRFIGFQEAEVDVCWNERTLRLRYIGEHGPNRVMNTGIGHFCLFDDYVLTVFVIPR